MEDDGCIDWENLLRFDDEEVEVEVEGDEMREEELMVYREIEKELMNDECSYPDDEQQLDIDNFLADILLPNSPSPSPVTTNNSSSSDHNNNNITTATPDADESGPLSKKRKRQLRNRDAAVRSRERKKSYVKDLESKSRFLEAECMRLGRLLHCCYAENHALRCNLHISTGAGAPMTKQESAVLFLELLLLGSLLWFLGIMCLLIVPTKFQTTPLIILEGKRNRGLENQAPKERGSNMLKICAPSYVKSRRCRGSRTKMKFHFTVAPILVL